MKVCDIVLIAFCAVITVHDIAGILHMIYG
jgi:hypothetical protein